MTIENIPAVHQPNPIRYKIIILLFNILVILLESAKNVVANTHLSPFSSTPRTSLVQVAEPSNCQGKFLKSVI